MLPPASQAWNSGRAGNFWSTLLLLLSRKTAGEGKLRTIMACEGRLGDDRRWCQFLTSNVPEGRRVLIRMVLLQRSDDFLLAKSGWQAEHLCLPTQSRAELQK